MFSNSNLFHCREGGFGFSIAAQASHWDWDCGIFGPAKNVRKTLLLKDGVFAEQPETGNLILKI